MPDVEVIAAVRIELSGAALELPGVLSVFAHLTWLEVEDQREVFGFVALYIPHTKDWRSIKAKMTEVVSLLRSCRERLSYSEVKIAIDIASPSIRGWSFDQGELQAFAAINASLSVNVLDTEKKDGKEPG